MRVSVFVDAGYVYGQGSSILTGVKKPKKRDDLELDAVAIVKVLRAHAAAVSNGKELLRIYWYDGAPLTGPSIKQTRFALLNDVKLRLGQLNREGQQKGVDSLIVTDLVELSRNKAISDAVVVTGDEDIRIGIQIAQGLGVRVHLLGISENGNQSPSLLQEADTISIWDKKFVGSFLKVLESEQGLNNLPPIVPDKPKPQAKTAPIKVQHKFELPILKTLELLTKQNKLKTAAATVKEGKEVPGYAVTILKQELLRVRGSPSTKTENKVARIELSKRLKMAFSEEPRI